MVTTAPKPSGKRVSVPDLEAFCVEAMLKTGMTEEDARLTADVLGRLESLDQRLMG